MNIQKKLKEIIPPNNYDHRHEFNNRLLIDELTKDERNQIEDALIEELYVSPDDVLIAETLSYMNSEKAIPALNMSLEHNKIPIQKVIIAQSIFAINKDDEMIKIAVNIFKQIHKKWDLIFVFSYLKKFDSNEINQMISKYVESPDFLISYNAKRALGLDE